MHLTARAMHLWKQMIQNLNNPDWASRHLTDDVASAALVSGDGVSDGAGSSLEMALSQMGLRVRPSGIQPPSNSR